MRLELIESDYKYYQSMNQYNNEIIYFYIRIIFQ